MKIILIFFICFVAITLNSNQIDQKNTEKENTYLIISDHIKGLENRDFSLDSRIKKFSFKFDNHHYTSNFIPNKIGPETFQYFAEINADSLEVKTESILELQYIEVKYRDKFKYKSVRNYFMYILLTSAIAQLFGGDVGVTPVHSLPILMSTLTFPAGSPDYFRQKKQNYFIKGKDIQIGIGVNAGLRPAGYGYFFDRNENNFSGIFGVSVQFQKEYLPVGISLKIYHFSKLSRSNQIESIKEGEELIINPSMKISFAGWQNFRSNIYIGLYSTERKIRRHTYPGSYYLGYEGEVGNNLETEFQYFISRNLAVNLSFLCLSSFERSQYPFTVGMTFYNSTKNDLPVTLANYSIGLNYSYLERNVDSEVIFERPIGIDLIHDIKDNKEIRYTILIDYYRENAPIAHMAKYTLYLGRNQNKIIKLGISVGCSFGEIYKKGPGIPVGIRSKLNLTRSFSLASICEYDLLGSFFQYGVGLEFKCKDNK